MALSVAEHPKPCSPIPLSPALLREIVARIVAFAEPERVILFGSHARGEARPDSDLDLLVVADSNAPRAERSAPLYHLLSDVPIAMDIVVYRPEEIEEWSAVPQAFVTTALRDGVILYERLAS